MKRHAPKPSTDINACLPPPRPLMRGIAGLPSLDRLADIAKTIAVDLKLELGEVRGGREYRLDAETLLPRQKLYCSAIAEQDDPTYAVMDLMRHIAQTHGPGRVWTVGQPIKYTGGDDGDQVSVWGVVIDGKVVDHVVLATYYFHEAVRS